MKKTSIILMTIAGILYFLPMAIDLAGHVTEDRCLYEEAGNFLGIGGWEGFTLWKIVIFLIFFITGVILRGIVKKREAEQPA